MGSLALLAFVVLLPTIAGFAALLAIRVARRVAEVRRRPPPAEPVDRIAERLRRLRAQLEAIENAPGGTARRHRLSALRGAYLDTLASACQRLGVEPPPGGERAKQADIYRVEAALRERGVDVREAAAR